MEQSNQGPVEEKETGRIEAFSDGVFAIALTLLVLDIQVPQNLPSGTRLIDALLKQWPAYVAYVTSFATISIMWINHHRLFKLIKRSDHLLMVFNSMLLLGVTFVPFPTALLADYFGQPDERVAAVIYSGTSIVIAVLFNVLWRYASYHNRLLDRQSTPVAIEAINRSYVAGPLLYSLAFVLAFFSVAASLVIIIGLALFFALPPRGSR